MHYNHDYQCDAMSAYCIWADAIPGSKKRAVIKVCDKIVQTANSADSRKNLAPVLDGSFFSKAKTFSSFALAGKRLFLINPDV